MLMKLYHIFLHLSSAIYPAIIKNQSADFVGQLLVSRIHTGNDICGISDFLLGAGDIPAEHISDFTVIYSFICLDILIEILHS